MRSLPARRFVDANVFVNWLKASPRTVIHDDAAAISGYVLKSIEDGEEALTTLTVKDEVAIWLSRYKAAALNTFLELLQGYVALEVVAPTFEDQIEAGKLMGRYGLGYTDLLSLRTMERYGVTEIYSSDAGFDAVPGISRVFLELREEERFAEFLTELGKLGRQIQSS